jgi:hypothetical protein
MKSIFKFLVFTIISFALGKKVEDMDQKFDNMVKWLEKNGAQVPDVEIR